jgi:type VI secretion system secreted protein VgrG
LSNAARVFFNHSHHKLWVRGLEPHLDVLAFHGEERLSQPFTYRVEFTSTEQDLAAEQLLGKDASFSLYAAKQPPVIKGLPTPEIKPLRTLNGVITALKRLSASRDEARYELTLQPRLALLERGRQYRIYQQQSVPEIVESILRSRHDFRGQDFLFRLVRETTPPSRPPANGAQNNCSATTEARPARTRTWRCWSRCSMTR